MLICRRNHTVGLGSPGDRIRIRVYAIKYLPVVVFIHDDEVSLFLSLLTYVRKNLNIMESLPKDGAGSKKTKNKEENEWYARLVAYLLLLTAWRVPMLPVGSASSGYECLERERA